MFKTIIGAALAVGVMAPASAAVVLNFAPGASAPSAGFSVIDEFNDLSNVTINSGTVKTLAPPTTGEGAPPEYANFGSSSYLSVLGGGSATINFGVNTTSFQFDWGSIDSYNQLVIVSNKGTLTVVPGSITFPNAANGDQHALGTNGLFTVTGDDGEKFTSITLKSGSNSFEIDNLAVIGGVPEPTTWAMLIVGFGMIGASMRRRRTFTTVSA